MWSSCHSAPDSKRGERGGRETGEGEGDRESEEEGNIQSIQEHREKGL